MTSMTGTAAVPGRHRPALVGLFGIVLAIGTTVIFYKQAFTQVAMPTDENSQCKLHYAYFHLLFTLPPLAMLHLLASPLLTQLDRHKLLILPTIAFVWTTPWDNKLVRHGAWWYPRSCVMARIGYVPIEEYAFFLLQSLITTLFTVLVTRWTMPRARGKPKGTVLLPLVPAAVMVAGIAGLTGKQGNGHHFYISMIAWWASVPLILLWFGTRRSWPGDLKRKEALSWLMCLAGPTVYLCNADVFAMRRGTWHIAESKSLKRFIVPDLPIEEALFFFMTNLILVSACFAFDRVVWQLRSRQVAASSETIAPMSPTNFRLSWSTAPAIWHTFLTLDLPVSDQQANEDQLAMQNAQDHAFAILQRASKSFHTASLLLPWDLRVDLGCLYAFARSMDDFIDTPDAKADSSVNTALRITLLRQLVDVAFGSSEKASWSDVETGIETVLRAHDAALFHHRDTQQQRCDLRVTAQAASMLRGIVPAHVWNELIDGYATDNATKGPCFQSFQQQAAYAQDVAGSVGDMCVRVVLARSGYLVDKAYRTPRDVDVNTLTADLTIADGEPNLPSITYLVSASSKAELPPAKIATLLRDARRMGVGLQLVNIARDIFKDAQELQRCYLVLGPAEEHLRSTLCHCMSGTDPSIDRSTAHGGLTPSVPEADAHSILTHKIALVDLAQSIFCSSVGTIALLPGRPAQTGLRVACTVYMAIGKVIQRDGLDGCTRRSTLSPLGRVAVALKAVYWGI